MVLILIIHALKPVDAGLIPIAALTIIAAHSSLQCLALLCGYCRYTRYTIPHRGPIYKES